MALQTVSVHSTTHSYHFALLLFIVYIHIFPESSLRYVAIGLDCWGLSMMHFFTHYAFIINICFLCIMRQPLLSFDTLNWKLYTTLRLLLICDFLPQCIFSLIPSSSPHHQPVTADRCPSLILVLPEVKIKFFLPITAKHFEGTIDVICHYITKNELTYVSYKLSICHVP